MLCQDVFHPNAVTPLRFCEAAEKQLNLTFYLLITRCVLLQSKDKLIASLKDGSGMSGQDSGISVAELEEMRQERDMFREEVHRSQMALENLRSEVAVSVSIWCDICHFFGY